MSKPLNFYTQQLIEFEKQSLKLKNKLFIIRILRFLVFSISFLSLYLTFGNYLNTFIVAFLGLFIFSFLVFKYIKIQKDKFIIDKKISNNKKEIKIIKRDFHHLDSGQEFLKNNHFYSKDIDMFGIGSFFQYINRTTTLDGKKLLANLLTENNTGEILNKQNAVKELSKKVEWRQHFSALASLVTVKNKSAFTTRWILSYDAVLPKYLKTIQILFSIISLTLILLISLGYLYFNFIVIWFFIGLFITVRYLKKTNKLYKETDNIRETFRQYHQLLNEIENENFVSKDLKEHQKTIQSEHKKASIIFKEFSKILDAFDNRNNIIVSVLGNGFFLWEISNACNVENWIAKYKHLVEKWFKVVAYFDCQNSMANFYFNHPDFVFPVLSESNVVLNAKNLGHPLLPVNKRIDNDFTILNEQFFIITGANMAGKSTFLRTVSLSIVLANCGLPVCAESFYYSPIKLITSMRTTDSLTEDESYFYSELKRLKLIVENIKDEKYFIILDEILKGTNSKDKAIGSKQFIEKLTKSKSIGIIATHDVSLCKLENEFSTIKNYYFDAEIVNNELFFDYKLKEGVCKNMNASFLLKKMEII